MKKVGEKKGIKNKERNEGREEERKLYTQEEMHVLHSIIYLPLTILFCTAIIRITIISHHTHSTSCRTAPSLTALLLVRQGPGR
jgi:hypothetical protein